MKVWYTGVDNGDGSLGVEFFDSQEAIEYLEQMLPEEYRGEGGHYFECDNWNGGYIENLEDVKVRVEERLGDVYS